MEMDLSLSTLVYCFLQVLHNVDQNIQSHDTFIPDTTGSAAEFFVYKRRKTHAIGGDGKFFPQMSLKSRSQKFSSH